MTRLEQITHERFGDDAYRLLEARAIVPLVDRKHPKAPVTGWMQGFDPKTDIAFHSLGVLVGSRSGITVWDIDIPDLIPPVDPNVKTIKGWHVYTAHSGEVRSLSPVEGLDILGENSHAIFYGPGKQFLHADLADSVLMHGWYQTLAGTSLPLPCSVTEQGYGAGLESRVKEQGYCEFLEEQGYTLDRDAVRNQYVKTLPKVAEGSRNATLYRYAREMVRCGLDLSDLGAAAIVAGLDPREVEATVRSAEVSVTLAPGKSVYDRVTFWIDNALPIVPHIAHEVMREIARRAIEINDLAPFFPQQDIADRLALRGVVKERSTISKTLSLLDSSWGVIKVVPLGHQPDGKRNPNAYRLCLGGRPVSEVDR